MHNISCFFKLQLKLIFRTLLFPIIFIGTFILLIGRYKLSVSLNTPWLGGWASTIEYAVIFSTLGFVCLGIYSSIEKNDVIDILNVSNYEKTLGKLLALMSLVLLITFQPILIMLYHMIIYKNVSINVFINLFLDIIFIFVLGLTLSAILGMFIGTLINNTLSYILAPVITFFITLAIFLITLFKSEVHVYILYFGYILTEYLTSSAFTRKFSVLYNLNNYECVLGYGIEKALIENRLIILALCTILFVFILYKTCREYIIF